MTDEVKPQEPSTLRTRYKKVRTEVESIVQTSFQTGSKLKEIGSLRKAAFLMAEQKQKEIEESDVKRKEAEELSMVDSLTGLPNLRWFDENLERKVSETKRTGSPLYLVMMDVDNLKKINETFGHSGGDSALKLVSLLPTRKEEPIARTGGDEFMQLVGENLSPDKVGEILRRHIERMHEISTIAFEKAAVLQEADPTSAPREVTMSFGVAQYLGKDDSIEELKRRADEALNHTKKSNKNGIHMAMGSGRNLEFKKI